MIAGRKAFAACRWRNRPVLVLLRAALLIILALSPLPACSNSILRNAAEAGLETVLDTPAPTPTPQA